jgi:hypothetical protein
MSTDTPFTPTVLRVLALEAAVIVALWLMGRYFGN